MDTRLPVIDLDHEEALDDRPATEPQSSEEPAAPEPAETLLTQQVRYYTAICSFAAGVLHLLAMAAHADHHPAVGRAFLAVAIAQIIWGVLLIVEPRKIVVILGGLMTAGAIFVWVLTRTKGISWFPGLEEVEALEWRDVVTQFFQLLALAGAALLLVPASWFRPAPGNRVLLGPIAVFAVLSIGALGVLYGATHNYTHHEHSGTEVGHTH